MLTEKAIRRLLDLQNHSHEAAMKCMLADPPDPDTATRLWAICNWARDRLAFAVLPVKGMVQ